MHCGAAASHAAHGQACLGRAGPKAFAGWDLRRAVADFNKEIEPFVTGNLHGKIRALVRQSRGRLGERNDAGTKHLVKAAVSQHGASLRKLYRFGDPALGSVQATHFEDVPEVGRKLQRQSYEGRLRGIIG